MAGQHAGTEPWVLDDPEVIDRLEDDGMFEAAEELQRLQERFQHFATQPLIAAAPELLEAADKFAVAWMCDCNQPGLSKLAIDLRAAITRATGAAS